mmetsp:Transcript_28914/g.42654  ORF Transcript_28914/g.42654 Transcript_28914/m.42654 type:complete len:91 (-) Transcript_28914:79-351(-)
MEHAAGRSETMGAVSAAGPQTSGQGKIPDTRRRRRRGGSLLHDDTATNQEPCEIQQELGLSQLCLLRVYSERRRDRLYSERMVARRAQSE